MSEAEGESKSDSESSVGSDVSGLSDYWERIECSLCGDIECFDSLDDAVDTGWQLIDLNHNAWVCFECIVRARHAIANRRRDGTRLRC